MLLREMQQDRLTEDISTVIWRVLPVDDSQSMQPGEERVTHTHTHEHTHTQTVHLFHLFCTSACIDLPS